MPQIHPKALATEMKAKGLTMAELARRSKVSAKQISRLLKGDSLKTCNHATLKRLSEALSVAETKLGEEHHQTPVDFVLGMKRTYLTLSDDDRMQYRFLEARYNVPMMSILRAAPVLFAALAELSLADRRARRQRVEESLSAIPEYDVGHLRNVRIGISRVEEGLHSETQSIRRRDLSGAMLPDDAWDTDYSGNGDLFVDFLERTLWGLAPEICDSISGSVSSIDAEMFSQELERLSNNDEGAEWALRKGDVHPAEIPSELLKEDAGEARADWIKSKLSDSTKSFLAARKKSGSHEKGIEQ